MEYLPIVHLLNTQNPKCVSERKKSAFLSAEHSERRGYLSRKRASQTIILDTVVNTSYRSLLFDHCCIMPITKMIKNMSTIKLQTATV